MTKNTVAEELEKFKSYLRQNNNEDAKRPLLYPLFQKLFKETFKIESDACGADVYIEGQLLVESKTDFSQWLEGFYQALHYHRRYGLVYSTVMVVTNKFVGIWKVNKLPETVVIYERSSDITKAPNTVGKENARRTQRQLKVEIRNSAFYWLEPKDLEGDIFAGAKNLTTESFEILKILRNLDSDRLQINTHNFIASIERMKPFFEHPIDAVHAFYTIVAFWADISCIAVIDEIMSEVRVVGFKGHKLSPPIKLHPLKINDFKKFIESQYVFTNEGSGLTVDYYFSRFDEVLSKIDPEYVKQHGIFFTNDNLSKFALWFVKSNFSSHFNENYIVFDPAGGSGNLVSSWKGKLKHKIISELQPDLLKIIERRMEVDPWHLERGFTIVPKTVDNKGLNFLNHSSKEYLDELKKSVKESTNLTLDKPLAFLLNPPYKNTKENEQVRVKTESQYDIHDEIIAITGEEASKERYLAFLGQILNISQVQVSENSQFEPAVLIFTPTSWLFPRPAFIKFRKIWDSHFSFHSGFLVTSNEWFKLDGKWPVAFTIWTYKNDIEKVSQKIVLQDLTGLKRHELNINWNDEPDIIDELLVKLTHSAPKINLSTKRVNLREAYGLKLYDFIRTPSKKERNGSEIFGGLPIKDERRHNDKTYGTAMSSTIGFMDNGTPVRIKTRGDESRFTTNNLKSIWFRLDTAFKDINKAKCFNGPTDTRSYCAKDLDSAKATSSWFAISKALNGNYPLWANQDDIWPPKVPREKEKHYYSLCFALVLAENRCIVSKFEENNPVINAPEIYIDNPLCPTNSESFWCTILENEIEENFIEAYALVSKIKELYRFWNSNYTKGKNLQFTGLHDEPYFKYFSYPDFLTAHSGLIQIRKFAEIHGHHDLLQYFIEISNLVKIVKEAIYRILIEDCKYFEN